MNIIKPVMQRDSVLYSISILGFMLVGMLGTSLLFASAPLSQETDTGKAAESLVFGMKQNNQDSPASALPETTSHRQGTATLLDQAMAQSIEKVSQYKNKPRFEIKDPSASSGTRS